MSQTQADDSLGRGGSDAVPLRRLRRHAEQLATYLSAVGSDLDRREAEVAAEQSRRDCELRAARLWMTTRIVNLRDLVERLQNQVAQVRHLVTSGQQAIVSGNKQDLDLVSIEQQLKTLELHLEHYQGHSMEVGESSEINCDLPQRTAALDFRERTLESAHRELAAAYHEMLDIRDSAELLLQHTAEQDKKQNFDKTAYVATLREQQSLRVHALALEEAEKRLRQVYAQITEERKKVADLKKMTSSTWTKEKQDLIREIHRLQAALEKSEYDSSSQKAA
jgi:hypothetical protein